MSLMSFSQNCLFSTLLRGKLVAFLGDGLIEWRGSNAGWQGCSLLAASQSLPFACPEVHLYL